MASLTIAHPQQVVFPSSVKWVLGKKESTVQWRTPNTRTEFTEKLSLIYRFPGGNIFLDKREYFVTLVKRQTVEDVSQQDKRRRSRADPCMRARKGEEKPSSRWSWQLSSSGFNDRLGKADLETVRKLRTFCCRIDAQVDERQVVIAARLLLNLQGKWKWRIV